MRFNSLLSVAQYYQSFSIYTAAPPISYEAVRKGAEFALHSSESSVVLSFLRQSVPEEEPQSYDSYFCLKENMSLQQSTRENCQRRD